MRLIDADDLIKNLHIEDGGTPLIAMRTDSLFQTIQEQPTAYNIDKFVDKVVKVLNASSERYQKYNYPENDYEFGFEEGCEYAFDNAVDIVKNLLKEEEK